jgi:CheY-like chemotaxis protein
MPRAENALSERESAKDQKRLLLALQNIVSTTKGYAELIAVMLEENLIVAGERLEAIRRYEQYVSDHLQDMEALVESALDRRPMAQLLEQEHPQLVLVCFDLAIQGEVVAELFRAQGMVVTQATSKEAATQILREQGSAFDLLVIGDWFDAAGHWLDASDDRRMILCNGRTFDHPRARLLSAPKLDMNHLLRAAIELSELEAG